MKRLSAALLFGSLLLAGLPVSAATFKASPTVLLSSPVMGDLYAAGRTVSISKDVNGDLFVAGRTVDVHNKVSQGLNAAGSTVSITSQVNDDVRAFGSDVTIRGPIAGDLLVGGGAVTVGSDAVIFGDAVAGGGSLIFRGTVGKNLIVRGGDVTLEGVFHGNIDVQAGNVVIAGPVEGNAKIVAENISIAQGASFKGTVEYWSRTGRANFGSALAPGQHAVYKSDLAPSMAPKAEVAGAAAAFFGVFSLLSILWAILVIVVFGLLTKTFFTDAAKLLHRRPWRCFFTGLLFVIAMPVVVFILFLSVLGVPLAILGTAAYILLLLFASPLSAMVLARWVEFATEKKWNKLAFFGMSLAAFLVLKILNFIPVIGWLVKGVLIFLALGAYLLTKYAKFKKVM